MNESITSESILIVDDEESAISAIEMALYTEGIENVVKCSDSRKVMGLLESESIGVVLLDLMMPYVRGEELLGMISEAFPDIVVIIVTAFSEIEKAVECIKKGAFDYIVKPVKKDKLCESVKRARESRTVRKEKSGHEERIRTAELRCPEAFSRIVTAFPEMIRIFHYIEAVAPGSRCIAVTGETGVGKELLVEAIHKVSGRTGELVAVNVSALDETAFSDTLFGHRKGAFTSAVEARAGLIEKASGGTLFLDEIGDLCGNAQVKLLRLLQEGEYLPLGSDSAVTTDTRVVVATHRSVDELDADPGFRKDLFYRLMTHHVNVPPLRERLKDDFVLLVDHFLDTYSRETGTKRMQASDELIAVLCKHEFPGNIRELEMIIYDSMSRSGGDPDVMLKEVSGYISRCNHGNGLRDSSARIGSVFAGMSAASLPTLREASDALIAEALRQTDGNQAAAARILGISSQALNQRLKRAGKGMRPG